MISMMNTCTWILLNYIMMDLAIDSLCIAIETWSSIISNEWDMKRICIIERTKWSSNEIKETFNLF